MTHRPAASVQPLGDGCRFAIERLVQICRVGDQVKPPQGAVRRPSPPLKAGWRPSVDRCSCWCAPLGRSVPPVTKWAAIAIAARCLHCRQSNCGCLKRGAASLVSSPPMLGGLSKAAVLSILHPIENPATCPARAGPTAESCAAKGKPRESAGRKVNGLTGFSPMTAGLPDNPGGIARCRQSVAEGCAMDTV